VNRIGETNFQLSKILYRFHRFFPPVNAHSVHAPRIL
jgi:hypothetical protein